MHLVCQGTALLSLSQGSEDPGALQESVQEAVAQQALVLSIQEWRNGVMKCRVRWKHSFTRFQSFIFLLLTFKPTFQVLVAVSKTT